MNASCPEYERLKAKFLKSEIMARVDAENEDLYEKLTNYSGQRVHDPTHVDYLFDVLYIEVFFMPNIIMKI